MLLYIVENDIKFNPKKTGSMSARSMAGMDKHPDIVELCAWYERAAVRPSPSWPTAGSSWPGCTWPSRHGWAAWLRSAAWHPSSGWNLCTYYRSTIWLR